MFHIALDFFDGPLDLLLFLVQKHELNILNIPVAKILDQYLDCIRALEILDIDSVGEFIVVASTLIEIKSFQVLPQEEEVETELEESRNNLVTELLAYKKFCENAGLLEERGRLWQRRYPRLANDFQPKNRNLVEEPIHDVELWDLVSAFGRIVREKTPLMKHIVKVTETPISVHMQRIYQRLKREQNVRFSSLFQKVERREILIGIFLAVLELVRHEYAFVSQKVLFGEIYLKYRESSKSLDFANISFDETPHFEQAG